MRIISMILFLIMNFGGALAQHIHTAKHSIIIETAYVYKDYPTEYSKSYFVVDFSTIDRMQVDTSFCDGPCIGYQITKNDGYYVEDLPVDIFTQACCSSGDIRYSMSVIDSIRAMNSRMDTVSRRRYFVDDILKKSKSFALTYVDSLGKYKGEYNLRIWVAKVDYCVCDRYMSEPGQSLYSNKAAYVTRVYDVSRLRKSTRKKLKTFVEALNF